MGRPSIYLQTCHQEFSTMLQVMHQLPLSSKSVVKLHCCPQIAGQSRAPSKADGFRAAGYRQVYEERQRAVGKMAIAFV